jgi:hypothetical protein
MIGIERSDPITTPAVRRALSSSLSLNRASAW